MTEEDIQTQDNLLPNGIRLTGILISFVVSVIIIGYIVAFILGCVKISPEEIDLTNILLFSLASFLFFAIPWNKLGLSLKKFGPLEFEKQLEGQSEEHVKTISELEEKIEKLESKLLSLNDVQLSPENDTSDNTEFEKLVTKFLKDYDEWAFSPLRIENWGSKKSGYSKLANNSKLLRKSLRKLVAEGVLVTRVSKKGNTLYKIKEKN